MLKHPFTRNTRIYAATSSGVEVFTGTLLGSDLPVAIKETQQATLEDANSAIQEAMTQRGLNHSGICKVYHCFVEQNSDGVTLKTVLLVELMDSDLAKEAERRAGIGEMWSEGELMGCVRTAVGALSYAQQMGVSHRDIKPQNIFISQGNVKIGDFGSSHQAFGASNFMTKTLQGSPLFLSPELKTKYANILQGLPANDEYDPFRSDVYSLGMTIAHLARLKPPLEMLNLLNLQQSTQSVCAEICMMYPELGQWIQVMLNIDPGRVNFIELERLLTQPNVPSQAPSIPVSIRPPVQIPAPLNASDSPAFMYNHSPPPLPFNNPAQTYSACMPQFTGALQLPAFTGPALQGAGSYQSSGIPFSQVQHFPSHTQNFPSHTQHSHSPRLCLVCGGPVLPQSQCQNFCSKKCSKKGFQSCKACKQRQVTTLSWLRGLPSDYIPYRDQSYQYCSLSCFQSAFPTKRCLSCGHWVASYATNRRGGNFCMPCSEQYRASRRF